VMACYGAAGTLIFLLAYLDFFSFFFLQSGYGLL